jgi:hypothetical protein
MKQMFLPRGTRIKRIRIELHGDDVQTLHVEANKGGEAVVSRVTSPKGDKVSKQLSEVLKGLADSAAVAPATK